MQRCVSANIIRGRTDSVRATSPIPGIRGTGSPTSPGLGLGQGLGFGSSQASVRGIPTSPGSGLGQGLGLGQGSVRGLSLKGQNWNDMGETAEIGEGLGDMSPRTRFLHLSMQVSV